MGRPFRFKQFDVHHDRCAMKVGTDGILLGAWADSVLPHDERSTKQIASDANKVILEIGAGSGLVSLMLAQRFRAAQITAVEICPEAARQATQNFSQSPWADRLQLLEGDVRSLSLVNGYDLVAVNPPFFSHSIRPENLTRANARHTETLTFADVVSVAERCLTASGKLVVVIPMQRAEEFCETALDFGLQLVRRCDVLPSTGKPAKRSLLQFQAAKNTDQQVVTIETMVLEVSRHNYSEQFRRLTQDFYLKH